MSRPPEYQYIILHKSTKSLGIAIVQAVHAATEAIMRLPVRDDTYVVVLEAEKSTDLEDLDRKLRATGVHTKLIREPDPPYFGAAVALATEPVEKETVKSIIKHLKVFTGEKKNDDGNSIKSDLGSRRGPSID